MPARVYTRVAVVQLACLPAIELPDRAPFEDPLFELSRPDALRPEGKPPEPLELRFQQLRARIARAYFDQLLLKVRAVLAQCQRWNVRLAVFPEYSLPWQVLEEVARAAGDVVVVAGTHTVTREAVRSGLYERLGGTKPRFGEAVCPVLHRGHLLGLQAKLSPAAGEEGTLKPGKAWAPVSLPDGLPGPMGVLICLDFLNREGDAHRELVRGKLEACRFLVVPSYTPHHTAPEFGAKAQEEARRYGRPVLWADVAVFSDKVGAGGSSIFVDEGRAGDLRRFPEHAGFLEPGDEGVLVSDVDLGFERVGESTRYDWKRPIVPFAAASLVYPARPAGERYAKWLGEVETLLSREDDDEAVEALAEQVAAARTVLEDAGTSGKAHEARMRRLLREAPRFHDVEEFRRHTREVVLPPEALPLPALRAALALGASDALFEWQKEWRGFGLGELVQRLHEAGKAAVAPDPGEWTEAGRAALAKARRAAEGEAERPERAAPIVEERRVMPDGVDPATLGERRRGGFVFRFRPRPEDFRTDPAGAGRELEAERLRGKERRSGEGAELESPEEVRGDVAPGAIAAVRELFLFAVAEDPGRVAAMAVGREGAVAPLILPVSHGNGGWQVWSWDPEPWWKENGRANGPEIEELRWLLEAEGLRRLEVVLVTAASFQERVAALASRFEGARAWAQMLRNARLASVNGTFVEPTVRLGERELPALEALDRWLASDDQTALLLGDYGAGKSTTLAEWCVRLGSRSGAPLPLLCILAAAATSRDAERLLLDAAGTVDTPSNRAALRLLVRNQRVLPVFDGFDEMATGADSDDLASRLSGLLGAASGAGRVVISSREHYFESEETLNTTTAEAMRRALGASTGLARLTVLPFAEAQVNALVRGVLPSEKVAEARRRIRETYDLTELVSRPLMLGMVLASLERIDPAARVAPADIYDAYLEYWLSQTREGGDSLSHEQKLEFAEALAEELWRSGETSCAWEALRRSVRERLGRKLPEQLTPAAALRDIAGGAFFVREGEERYRFAHKSFLEYFLARALVATLEVQPLQALDTRPITREVAAFVGELLRRNGNPRESPAVRGVHVFLQVGRGNDLAATSGAERYGKAAANALRLLHGLAVWAQDEAAWVPEGADLRGLALVGEDLRGARLARARLSGTSLAGGDLSRADLEGAELTKAVLRGVRLEGTQLRGAVAREADFTQAEATGCDARGADFTWAVLAQGVWLDGVWEGAALGGVDVTAAVLAPLPSQAAPATALVVPALLRARLAEGHEGKVLSVAVAADGGRVASGGADGSVRLWDGETGRLLMALSGHAGRVWSVALAADGKRVASGGDDGSVRLWDAETGRLLVALSGHAGTVWSVALAADGGRVASGGDDGIMRLWDGETGRLLMALSGHEGRVLSVAVAADGGRVASGGDDGSVRLWDAETGRLLVALPGHKGPVWSVAVAAGGGRVASGGDDGSVRLWDAETGHVLVALPGHAGRVLSVALAADGGRVASGGDDGSVRLWDGETGRLLVALRGHEGPVWSVALAADGGRVTSGGDDGSVRLWDGETGRLLVALSGHEGWVLSVALAAGGGRVASGGDDGIVRLWDAETGRLLVALPGHEGTVWSVALAADGGRVASGGDDGSVRLWDVETGRLLMALSGREGRVWSVALAADGGRVASGGEYGRVRLWDAETGRLLMALSGHEGRVLSVALAADGGRVASGGEDGSVRLWDGETGRLLMALSGHEGRVLSVALAADGGRVASGGDDGSVRVWDAETGRLLVALPGHEDPVRSVALAADGRRVASGGDDGSVRLWDAETGRLLVTLPAHQGLVRSVALTADGRRVASGGADGVFLWDSDSVLPVCQFQAVGESVVTSTPSGFCVFDGDPSRHRLAVRRPDQAGTVLYLPIGALRSVFDRPDKVREALAGHPVTPDDFQRELAARGWADGEPWNGERHLLPETPAPAPAASAPPLSLPDNPFRPGPALLDAEALAGREATVIELLSLVKGRSPAIVLGPRRAGKTSLLSLMARRLGAGSTVRSVSLEGQRPRTADELALLLEPGLAAPRTRKRARARRDSSPSARVLSALEHAPGHVFLLDELAWLDQGDDTLFPWLRSVGQRHAAVVLAGSRWDWTRVVRRAADVCPGSSFGNDVTEVGLGPIDEAEARRFLIDTSSGVIEDTVARWVVELCGAWPFYLQVMGHALFVAAETGRRKPFNERAALAELYDQRLLTERTAVFEGRFRELPEPVQRLLRAHRDARPVFRELPPEERVLLMDTGLCTASGAWLTDRPFFEWIQRRASALE